MFLHDRICTDCNSNTIIETSHELLCKSCGLVIQDRLMQDEPEWRVFDFDSDPSRVGLPDAPTVKNSITHILSNIQSILHIPESICKLGGIIFGTIDKQSKGAHRIALVHACVYYAQREMSSGSRTKQEMSQYLGIDLNALIKASYTVKEHLFRSQEWRHLTIPKNNKDDTLHRMLILVTDIPTDQIQQVKKIIHKIHTKVSTSPKLDTIQVEKINAALIYMACNFAGIKTTMTHVANVCGTSLATIIKIEALIKQMLSSS